MRAIGQQQVAVLIEAADEVTTACPWVWIENYERRQVSSLSARGLVGSTEDVFGIMPRGCLVLRSYDRGLARRALAGLRRNRDNGEVMPWHV